MRPEILCGRVLTMTTDELWRKALITLILFLHLLSAEAPHQDRFKDSTYTAISFSRSTLFRPIMAEILRSALKCILPDSPSDSSTWAC